MLVRKSSRGPSAPGQNGVCVADRACTACARAARPPAAAPRRALATGGRSKPACQICSARHVCAARTLAHAECPAGPPCSAAMSRRGLALPVAQGEHRTASHSVTAVRKNGCKLASLSRAHLATDVRLHDRVPCRKVDVAHATWGARGARAGHGAFSAVLAFCVASLRCFGPRHKMLARTCHNLLLILVTSCAAWYPATTVARAASLVGTGKAQRAGSSGTYVQRHLQSDCNALLSRF